jgi:hypothetical protein
VSLTPGNAAQVTPSPTPSGLRSTLDREASKASKPGRVKRRTEVESRALRNTSSRKGVSRALAPTSAPVSMARIEPPPTGASSSRTAYTAFLLAMTIIAVIAWALFQNAR